MPNMTPEDRRQRAARGRRKQEDAEKQRGKLGILVDGFYVFWIEAHTGYCYCRIEHGVETEIAECIPKTALDPYARVVFVREGPALVAVDPNSLDAVNIYGQSAPALNVPSQPMGNRGSGDWTPTNGNILLGDGTQFVSTPLEDVLTAPNVTYTPTTPSDWSSTPTDVQEALDDLAAQIGAGSGIGDYILIQDQKSQNTSGGTFTSGAWRTRDLNTEVVDTGGYASVASNQITLANGDYRVNGSAPALGVNSHQTRLQNITDGVTEIVGTSEYQGSSTADTQNRSILQGRLTVTGGPKVYEVQHQCGTTRATNGFGVAANLTTEVYATIELIKE